MKSPALTPIRIVRLLRTSRHPEGIIIEERILRPLNKEERKAGAKDELKEWYRTFGYGKPSRRQHRRQQDKMPQPRKAPVPNDPPKDVQTEVYQEIRAHLHLVAMDLARAKLISYSDIPDIEHDLFRAAIDDLVHWNPEKSSRKTFLYESSARNKIDIVRRLNAKKRQGDYTRLSISNESASADSDGDAAYSDGVRAGSVSAESIPDRCRSIEQLEFRMAFHDLIERLDADELLALDYLLADFPHEEIAKMMGLTRPTWRRTVLESIQMKAELCGFIPRKKKGVFHV